MRVRVRVRVTVRVTVRVRVRVRVRVQGNLTRSPPFRLCRPGAYLH